MTEITPHAPMPTGTLLREEGLPLLWIDGLLPLPPGARLHLDNLPGGPEIVDRHRFPSGHADAIVIAVEVFGAVSDESHLALAVELVPRDQTGG
jgi:hypothetical protein